MLLVFNLITRKKEQEKSMKTNNLEIRQMIEHKRLRYYEVANACGVTPGTLSVWLQTELTPKRHQRIVNAINSITI